jgi:acetyl-CoA acetyltransferase
VSSEQVRDATAIVGVGTAINFNGEAYDDTVLMADAVGAALDDAGLTRDDLDGILVNVAPPELSMDTFAMRLGLSNVRYAFQTWRHGRMAATVCSHAALAAFAGMADYVAQVWLSSAKTFRTRQQLLASDPETVREGGGTHAEIPHYGLTTQPGGAAMAMQKYLNKYGYSPSDIGVVSVAQRTWAQQNPRAAMCGRPLTQEDYEASPYVIEPLRVHDMARLVELAGCVIVSASDRAKDLHQSPIYIGGMQGSRSHRDVYVFGRSNLGVWQQTDRPYLAPDDMHVYRMANIRREDVQILGVFDTVSPLVPFALEEFGFCGEGEALEWMREGPTMPGGKLPVNTHGGSLSEGMTGGGAIVELVRQLRGSADGGRQVPGAEVGQFISSDRSSILLHR